MGEMTAGNETDSSLQLRRKGSAGDNKVGAEGEQTRAQIENYP